MVTKKLPVYERWIILNGDKVATVLTTQIVTDYGEPRDPVGYLIPFNNEEDPDHTAQKAHLTTKGGDHE